MAATPGSELRPVFITGMVRCGSSWVGRVLAAGTGTRYVYEPLNPTWAPQLRGHWRQFTYLAPADQPAAAVARAAQAAFAGRQGLKLRLRALYRGYLWSTLRPARRVLVKDPTACLASAWIHHQFDARMVLITRHPCGFASSMALHGWPIRLRSLLRQPRLMEDHLGAHAALMERAERDDWLRLGAFWAAVHIVLRDWVTRYPDWLLVTYEELCQRPLEAFTALAANTGLEFAPRALARSLTGRAPDAADSGATQRDSARMADVWRQRLSPAQIDAVMGMVRDFGIMQYPLTPARQLQSP